MIKLVNLLKEITEAKQVGNLYHFTPLSNLKKILATRLMFPNDEGAISTSIRPNMSTRDFHDMKRASIARLMFDGDKISTKYKVRPFAFGADEGNPEDLGEEQIITNDGKFPFVPYLKRIDIFLNKKETVDPKILELLEKANIPYKVYQGTPISNIPYSQPKTGNPEDINIDNIPKKEIYTQEDMYFPGMKSTEIQLYLSLFDLKHDSPESLKVYLSPKYPNYYITLKNRVYSEWMNLKGKKINSKETPIPMYNDPKWQKMWKQVEPPYNSFNYAFDSYILIPKNEVN